MQEMWTHRDETVGDLDVTGYSVEAVDGSIGKVDEATHQVGMSYVVVDTGPWILGKKVLLPAGVIERIDVEDETVFVDRTKDEIKNAPELDSDNGGASDEEYRRSVGTYYAGGVRERERF
jgi:hypothetical protein